MKTIQVYRFLDLDAVSRDCAIQEWYDDEDYPFLTEDLTNRLKELDDRGAFSNITLQYSLSYSQGGGLSFSADIDLSSFNAPDGFTARSTGNTGRYCYAAESQVEIEGPDGEGAPEDLLAAVTDYYMRLCVTAERLGYDILDYRMPDAEFADICEENGYVFNARGHMVNL